MHWEIVVRYLAVFLSEGRWFAEAARRDDVRVLFMVCMHSAPGNSDSEFAVKVTVPALCGVYHLLWSSRSPRVSHNCDQRILYDMCRFPAKWEGTWFQSGVRTPVTIELNRLSTKGRCVASEGDKFLVVDDNGVCYKCIVIHEKHINVLQYKETYCHPRNSLYNICTLITGDALLFSMFRLNAQPVHCPFKPPLTFTYNRGHGECKSPVSTVESCIEESKLVLRFQACPDVSATESTIEEVECVGVWKEGSSRYLVAKVSSGHIASNEDLFRCYVYEKANTLPNGQIGFIRTEELSPFLSGRTGYGVKQKFENVDYKLAQSGDATCNGLFSPMEGSKTMSLKKGTAPVRCKFPGWLTYFQHWHTLDYRKSYTFHHRNTTLRITNNSAVDVSHSDGNILGELPDIIMTSMGVKSSLSENGEIRLICADIKSMNQSQVNMIAHFTIGCESGYVCLWFYKRDVHVIEVQSGSTAEKSSDACNSDHFNYELPFITLVTTNPEPRECPYSGKFSVEGISKMERQKRSIAIIDTKEIAINRDQNGRNRWRRNFEEEEPCEEEVSTLVVGCETSDTLEFRSQCSSSDMVTAYSCHGRWTENDMNFLITTPQSRTSIGAKRYCFIYKEVGGIIHFSSSSQSCMRNINTGVEGVLAFNATNIGKCLETSRSSVLVNDATVTSFFVSISILLWRRGSR